MADPLADRLMIDAAVSSSSSPIASPGRSADPPEGYCAHGRVQIVVPRGYDFSVSFSGKLATWILYASLGFVLVTHAGTTWPLVIFWIGFGLAVAAGVLYLATAVRETRTTA